MKFAALLLTLLFSVAAAVARQQPAPPPATFGVDPSPAVAAPGHGWMLEFDADLKQWILIHIPPRGGSSVPTTDDGTIRGVMPIATAPGTLAGLAAVDDAVYVLLDDPVEQVGAAATIHRRVMMTRAIVAGLGYVYEPVGRLAATAPLAAPGTLEGFCGTSLGPAICAVSDQRLVQVLVGDQWRPVQLPKNLLAAQQLQLVPDQSGRLALFNAATRELFLARLQTASDGAIEPPQWTNKQLTGFPAQTALTAVIGEEAIAPDVSSGNLRLIRGSSLGARVLETIQDAPPSASIVLMPASRRAVIIWTAVETIAGKKTIQHTEMSEISIDTGRAIYRGRSRSASPISAEGVRTLVILLIVFMSSVLLVLLRPVPDGKETTLPEGASLADSSRRALAGVVDFAVSAFIAVKAFSLTGSDLSNPEFWFGMNGIELLISILVVGFIVSTMGETMIGRSLGKLVTGCEVISVLKGGSEPHEQPRFRQIVIRNSIKWLIPPISLSILLDPTLRHRGDLLAGTAVVVWEPQDEDDDEDLDS